MWDDFKWNQIIVQVSIVTNYYHKNYNNVWPLDVCNRSKYLIRILLTPSFMLLFLCCHDKSTNFSSTHNHENWAHYKFIVLMQPVVYCICGLHSKEWVLLVTGPPYVYKKLYLWIFMNFHEFITNQFQLNINSYSYTVEPLYSKHP